MTSDLLSDRERERYPLNIWQQLGDDGVRHFVHGVQSGDDGRCVEGEDDSELGAASRVSRVRLQTRRYRCEKAGEKQQRSLPAVRVSQNVNTSGPDALTWMDLVTRVQMKSMKLRSV